MSVLDLLKKVLPDKVIENAYDDALSPGAKELGKIGINIVKTMHLMLAPLQFAAAFQDRVAKMCVRIAQRVPEARQIDPPVEVVGPALERMKYIEDGNPLWLMFEELIARSCDKEEIEKVHPAFPNIIAQLSPDEAVILYLLSKEAFEMIDVLDLNRSENRFENRQIEENNLPLEDLLLPDRIDLYYSHLESLSLVAWPIYKEEPINDHGGQQTGTRRFSRLHLTEFGCLFVDACLPKSGFSIKP